MILFQGSVNLMEIVDQTQLRINLRSHRASTTIMTEIFMARSKHITSFATERNSTVAAEFVISFIVEASSSILYVG